MRCKGADDYVTKPFGVMELISRVKALMRRSYPIGNEQMHQSGNIFMDETKRAVFAGESRTLDMHIKTLRKKLGEEGSLIQTIRNVGYMIPE